MIYLKRIFFLFALIKRYRLLDLLMTVELSSWLRYLINFFPQSNEFNKLSLPERLRLALQDAGPIFVKFGQLLSTRPDMFPEAYIKELSQLQDKVASFPTSLATAQIEKDFHKTIEELYIDFNPTPVASASIAQIYQAYLREKDGTRGPKVAIKVIRPQIRQALHVDIRMLSQLATWAEKLSAEARRLKFREVINEFQRYTRDEVNLVNEGANGSLLHRQFRDSSLLVVPEIYFDYTTKNVLTMEWMEGIPISDTARLKKAGIDLKALALKGTEIFFTQVFDNGFFHADMHPGNILVAEDGRYIALDFGIVGSLTDYDKRYLAINFLAFFNRDYYRVAEAHIESRWAPKETRLEELEAAIRYVCEPAFNRPLAKISFSTVLLRLFEVSRRFNIPVQPQLVLLQKTLLNVEGLGRQLDPDLNLWEVGKPFFIRWTREQFGFKSFYQEMKKEATHWSYMVPELPRKLYEALDESVAREECQRRKQEKTLQLQTSIRNWLVVLCIFLFLKLFFI